MFRIKLNHLTLILLCCVLHNQTTASATPLIRYKRSTGENQAITEKNSLNGLVLEALDLEKNYSELKNSSNVTLLYQNLLDRCERVELDGQNKEHHRALSHLILTLQYKLDDIESENDLIIKLLEHTRNVIRIIELRNQLIPTIENINDSDVENNLNQLRFLVNGHFFLNQYQHNIEGFRLIYFPFAVDYLESLRLPTTPTAYGNLDAMTSTMTNKLDELIRNINEIDNGKHRRFVGAELEYNQEFDFKPENAFYIWKNSDVGEEIRQLFKGEQIALLADVTKATNQFNVVRFSRIDLVFRSSNQTVNEQLNVELKRGFQVKLYHSGRSAFRCNNNFYESPTNRPLVIISSFEQLNYQHLPVSRNLAYDKLQSYYPVLSPYTEWKFQLLGSDDSFQRLAQFEQFDFDFELYGFGMYVEQNLTICENEKLSQFYTQLRHDDF